MNTRGQSKICTRLLRLVLSIGVSTTVCAQVPDVVWQATATNSKTSNPLAISPDGQVAATMGTNEEIQIWRMSDGEPLQELMGHSVWVGALAFSPEGTYLASTGYDAILRVRFTSNWTLAYAATNVQGEVAFSPDGTTLATSSGTNIELRHAANGALYHSWPATSPWNLTFSPDGTKIASGGGWLAPGWMMAGSRPATQRLSHPVLQSPSIE